MILCVYASPLRCARASPSGFRSTQHPHTGRSGTEATQERAPAAAHVYKVQNTRVSILICL